MYSVIEKIEIFRENYIREYGERKYRKVLSKIHSSKKIGNLIHQSQIKQLSPNKNDFLYCLNEVPFFMFSKADTLAIGAVLALELWHNTLNQDYYYLDEYNLNRVFEGIIIDCDKIKLNL